MARKLMQRRTERPGSGAVPVGTEEHIEDTTTVGDIPELQQHEDWGPPAALKVRLDSPALTHELPTRLGVCRTIPVLSPERLLAADERRARALIIASGQGLRLGRTTDMLQAGGSGIVSGQGTVGQPAGSSGGGTGGFLCPIGVPIPITTQDQIFGCSADFGVGNNPCFVSLLIEQWAD